ncbi:hypothetical protein ACM1RC_21205 [Paenibacillus azoreducens]|uniref:hypothetical protein n=1 Tax=Paenibacillus azoreducens TaxID=116718 RepID=UPI0039F4E806
MKAELEGKNGFDGEQPDINGLVTTFNLSVKWTSFSSKDNLIADMIKVVPINMALALFLAILLNQKVLLELVAQESKVDKKI